MCDTYSKCSRNKVLCTPRVREVTWGSANLKFYKMKDFMEEVALELDLEGQIESQWIGKGMWDILEGGQNTGKSIEIENAFRI